MEIKCGIMLPNSMQCINNVWAYWNGIPKCRLHFSYDLMAANNVDQEYKIANEMDQRDLDSMLQMKKEQMAVDKNKV